MVLKIDTTFSTGGIVGGGERGSMLVSEGCEVGAGWRRKELGNWDLGRVCFARESVCKSVQVEMKRSRRQI